MKLLFVTMAVICSLLVIDGAKLLHESGLLEEAREDCAQDTDSCSTMGLGSGPTTCCNEAKECTCTLSGDKCDCRFDRRNVSAGDDWEKAKKKLD